MNTSDWLQVAALLREMAEMIEAHAADGMDGGSIKLTDEVSGSRFGGASLRHRRQSDGLSFRSMVLNQRHGYRITLTTETN